MAPQGHRQRNRFTWRIGCVHFTGNGELSCISPISNGLGDVSPGLLQDLRQNLHDRIPQAVVKAAQKACSAHRPQCQTGGRKHHHLTKLVFDSLSGGVESNAPDDNDAWMKRLSGTWLTILKHQKRRMVCLWARARHINWVPVCRALMYGTVQMSSTAATQRDGRHKNKVAIITGSTMGIGFAIARRLAEDGAHVVVSSRKKVNVDRAVEELKAENLSVLGTICHVGKEEDRQRLIAKTLEQHGGIDYMISNAAVNPFVGNILDSTAEIWDKALCTSNSTKQRNSSVVPNVLPNPDQLV
ncbi:uncharacterized protein [Pleurodeles waltl]|uniref:uncharacterized protein n=1 Tax=Pleurodeles waltl TaxID=8319 RepID=UPI00370957D0